MKILQLTGYFMPEKAASMYLTENRLETFVNADINVEVYASRPTRGLSEEEYEKFKKKKLEVLYDGKLRIHRFPMYREGKNSILRALRYSLCWIIQLYYGLKEKDVNCIYLESTPPIQGLLGALIKKFKGIPFVYGLQDIFPDSLVGTSLTKKNSIIWKIGRQIENFTYKYCDKIIVISEDFKNNIIKKGVPEDKIEVVYNWVDENAVINITRDNNILFDKYNLDRSKFYIEYSGNIGLTQNMDLLLEVMEELQQSYPMINLVLIGEGAYKDKVEKIITDRGLDNVKILPFQPYEEISQVFSLGDVGLVISKPGVGSNSVPSKTWSIMSASKPVLASFDENELKQILEENRCGIFISAGKKEALKDAIIKFYNNNTLCEILGNNGRKYILKNLTREIGTQKYLKIIKSVIKNQ